MAPAAGWRRAGPGATARPAAPGWAGLRQPGSLPDPRLPAGTDTIPQIEHIVVVMMENHPYDNHLGIKNQGTKVVPIAGFFTDAAAGTLPGFCLVEPEYGTADEENPQNIARGEAFAAQVINAVMAGPGWERTLLIWTFDEHGGYYDHVRPPRAVPPDAIAPAVPAGQSAYDGFGRYGFRVPCAIVSPWARRRYVSHRVFDHASICKLVETRLA